MRTTLIALSLLLAAPTALAQGPGPDGRVYVTLPHSVDLRLGTDTVQARITGALQCEPGTSPPPPLQVAISPASGPDDGHGPAWRFPVSAWSVDWTAGPDGNYTIGQALSMTVEAAGYGAKGYAGDLVLQTTGLRGANGSCRAQGFFIPATGEHTHLSVPARPGFQPSATPAGGAAGSATAGAPGPEAALALAAVLLGVGLRKR